MGRVYPIMGKMSRNGHEKAPSFLETKGLGWSEHSGIENFFGFVLFNLGLELLLEPRLKNFPDHKSNNRGDTYDEGG
jgi:hypothetical protein